MAFTTSPNMNLTIPSVGTQPGPDYAFNINNSLTLIDQHDHTPGKGVQIVTAALNINANLSLNDFSLIDATSIVFTPSTSATTTPQSLSVAPGGESPQQQDLWYTPNTGVPIQITKNGAVNVVASSIEGESYAAGTFFWTQAQDALPTTPANFDIGSITLRPNTALTTFGVILSPASAISSEYQINLPLIPLVKNLVTLDTSGNMVADTNVDNSSIEIVSNTIRVKAQGITAAMILNNTITTNQISLTAGITQGQLADDALAWREETFTLLPTPSFVVRVATTVNGVMSTAFDNGSTVDGVVIATNDLILIKNQTVTTDNGVYVVQASGVPLRSTSYDTFTELNAAGVTVTAGTANAGTNWWQNNILTSLASPQSWSTSSTEIFVVPDGVNQLIFEAAGGGGGGAGGGGNSNGAGAPKGGGGGGGAGGPVSIFIQDVTPGDEIFVTVGAGGTGGAGGSTVSLSTGTNGTNGATTTIASINFTANFLGGAGGGGGGTATGSAASANGVDGNASQVYAALGGAGGASSTGLGGGGGGGSSINFGGAGGISNTTAPTTGKNGGGGGGGSNLFAGAAGGPTLHSPTSSAGGTSSTAGGGGGGGNSFGIGGAGGTGAASPTAGTAAAADTGAGGGGGGGRSNGPAIGAAGAAGGSGKANIRYLKGGA